MRYVPAEVNTGQVIVTARAGMIDWQVTGSQGPGLIILDSLTP